MILVDQQWKRRLTQNPTVKPFLEVLSGHRQPVPPLWMMRQAGRYLPEYREVRAKAGGFLDLCFTPEFAAEVTLQPIRRFNFDAAIIFSDILVIPYALGRSVRFEVGEGPRLDPLDTPDKVGTLVGKSRHSQARTGVRGACAGCGANSIRRSRLIGFCGAPWTVATYMVAGQGTPDQAPARHDGLSPSRSLRENHRRRSSRTRFTYLLGQLKAGADVLQIFDTWAGVLPPREFQRWSIEPTKRIVEGVRKQVPDAKIIGFPRGAGALLPAYVEATGVDAVSIDWATEPSLIREKVQNRVAVQGNLDPLALIAGGAALDRVDRRRAGELRRGTADLQPRPRHSAGNPDRACRADGETGTGLSAAELVRCSRAPRSTTPRHRHAAAADSARPFPWRIVRPSGPGRGDVSTSTAAIPAARNCRAALIASSSARGRPCAPSRAILARPSVSKITVGVCPLRRMRSASANAASSPAASGVPPPPGKPARLRLARASERVGGNSNSAALPRNAISAT